MVTEIAIFQAAPGKEEAFAQGIQQGIEVVKRDPGCRSASASRCIEDPGRFLLTVQWESLEAHNEGFRKSPQFAEWRSHITGLFLDNPVVFHYEALGS